MDYGYVMKLDETVPTRINALRVGTYQHPVYGEVKITPERLQRFATNVVEKVRGIDPDIDYDHKSETKKAAGWVKGAAVEDDSLFLDVEWTPAAAEAIKNKEYRYFSAEIQDEWEDPEGKVYQDVLFGGGLSNRPWFKNLAPLNFDEFYEDRTKPLYPYQMDENTKLYVDLTETYAEDSLTFRDIPQSERKKHPSSDFAGSGTSFPIFKCEDVAAAARSMGRSDQNSATLKRNIISIAKRKGFSACLPESWKSQSMEEVNELDPKLFAELLGVEEDEEKITAEVTRLKTFYEEKSGEEEHAKKFAEEFPDEAKRLEELVATNKFNEATARLTEWKGMGLPPAVEGQFHELRRSIGDTEKFDEAMAELLKTGLVDTKELGGSNDPSDKPSAQKFEEKIDAILTERSKDNPNYTYSDALTDAKNEFSELASAYIRGGE